MSDKPNSDLELVEAVMRINPDYHIPVTTKRKLENYVRNFERTENQANQATKRKLEYNARNIQETSDYQAPRSKSDHLNISSIIAAPNQILTRTQNRNDDETLIGVAGRLLVAGDFRVYSGIDFHQVFVWFVLGLYIFLVCDLFKHMAETIKFKF